MKSSTIIDAPGACVTCRISSSFSWRCLGMTTKSHSWNMPVGLEMLLEQSKRLQSMYRPVVFRLDREEDQVRCSQLLESGTHVLVYDHLQGQLEELIKSRMPHRRSSQADLEQEVRAWLAD